MAIHDNEFAWIPDAKAPVPAAWIIERPGRPPTMIHYADCAEKAQEMGYIVTPYYSKVTK